MWSLTGISYRVIITTLNILFPPLAVMLVAGPEYDCLLNCFLFLLAVIPSHIHGFYISCVYFHRRHKVRKGQYPGGPKSLIRSKNVINGGASDREVERLYMKEKGISGRSGSRRRSVSRSGTKKSEMEMRRDGSMSRVGSKRGYGAPAVYDDRVARDGYGPPPPPQQQRRGRWYK